MITSSSPKRRRVVTACRECHRRKQKCNREKPCNICIARKVPQSCVYGDVHSSSQRLPLPPVTKQEQGVVGKVDAIEANGPPNLSENVGYSWFNEDTTYSTLQRVEDLQGQDQTQYARVNKKMDPITRENEIKFRAIIKKLPSRTVINELIANFFSESSWFSRVVERHYFEKLQLQWYNVSDLILKQRELGYLLRELQYFPALLFQTMAVALQFLPPNTASQRMLGIETSESCDELSKEYSGLGMDIMTLFGRHNSTIVAVQHDLMRSLWLKNFSRGTEAWYSLGDSIRQAQELGLHVQAVVTQSKDIRETLSRLWYDEYKRRIWVTLFSWDIHMAMMLGRPRTINLNDCTIKTPLDCDIPDDPSNTVPATTDPQAKPSSYSFQLFHYALGHKMHEMLALGANKRHIPDYSLVTNLHEQINALLNTLPPVVRPENPDKTWDSSCPYLPKQRFHIASAAHAYLISLHRPHASTHPNSRQAATNAALKCLEAHQHLFHLVSDHHFKIYSLSFHTIDAGIYLSTSVLEHPPTDLALMREIQIALSEAISRLQIMKEKSPMAKSGLQILMTLFQKIQWPCQAENVLPNTAIPVNAQYVEKLSMGGQFQATQNLLGQIQPSTYSLDYTYGDATNHLVSTEPLESLTDITASSWLENMDEFLNWNADFSMPESMFNLIQG